MCGSWRNGNAACHPDNKDGGVRTSHPSQCQARNCSARRARSSLAGCERNQLLQNILLNIPVGLSVMDRNLNLVADNPLFRKLLDFPDSLFAGPVTTFESIIRFNALRGEYGPGDPQAITAAIVERARHAEPHQFERHRPDGVTLEVRGAPMPGGGFVTSYSDITEIKKSEERVRQQERLFRGAIDAARRRHRVAGALELAHDQRGIGFVVLDDQQVDGLAHACPSIAGCGRKRTPALRSMRR